MSSEDNENKKLTNLDWIEEKLLLFWESLTSSNSSSNFHSEWFHNDHILKEGCGEDESFYKISASRMRSGQYALYFDLIFPCNSKKYMRK